jgi:hypothetical protein
MKVKRIMIILLITLAVITAAVSIYMRLPKFGKLPAGERLERIKQSPYFKEGIFKNLHETPQMTNEKGFGQMMKEYFSATNKKPQQPIPSVKTDLHNLPKDKDVLIWFGHSSYFIQIEGKRILVDPVLSGHASPFTFSVNAFEGTDIYEVDDIPVLDFLVITHDHWDHLDYKTVVKLKSKVGKVITGLGVGSHLEHWGFNQESII